MADEMVRLQLLLSRQQKAWLEEESRRRTLPMGGLIRDFIQDRIEWERLRQREGRSSRGKQGERGGR
jgi:hypothetical protein